MKIMLYDSERKSVNHAREGRKKSARDKQVLDQTVAAQAI